MSEPIMTLLGVKLSVLQGAGAGTAISFLLSTGSPWQRVTHAVVGALFAVYGTEGAIEITRGFLPVSDSTQRLGGMVFGIIGVLLTQAIIKAATKVRDSDGIGSFVLKWLSGFANGFSRANQSVVSPEPQARIEPTVTGGGSDPQQGQG